MSSNCLSKTTVKPLLCGMLLVLAAGGCAKTKMGTFNVNLRLDESLADADGVLPSVEVHLLALDRSAGVKFQTVSMTDYWNPNRRKDGFAKYVVKLGQDKPKHLLNHKEHIWNRWLNAGGEYLFVLGDIPIVYDDQQDVSDPRRLIFPLEKKRWRRRNVDILVLPDGVVKETPHRWLSKK